ncbi:MAG: hypothetical protein M3N95_01370 [Actinomycetota bacterium]|nr:hypothetical protein [Actinomycetota bacterium]
MKFIVIREFFASQICTGSPRLVDLASAAACSQITRRRPAVTASLAGFTKWKWSTTIVALEAAVWGGSDGP